MKIITAVFCLLAFQGVSQITTIPNVRGVPFRFVADSVFVVDDGYLYVPTKNNKYQIVQVVYNDETKAYRVEASGIMSRREAREAVKNIKREIVNREIDNRRARNRLKRDSIALENLSRYIASDTTGTVNTGN